MKNGLYHQKHIKINTMKKVKFIRVTEHNRNSDVEYHNDVNDLRIWHSCTTTDHGYSRWSVTNKEGTKNYPLTDDNKAWEFGTLSECKKRVIDYINNPEKLSPFFKANFK